MAFNVRSGGEHIVIECPNPAIKSGDAVRVGKLCGISETDPYISKEDGKSYITLAAEGVGWTDVAAAQTVGNTASIPGYLNGASSNAVIVGIVIQSETRTDPETSTPVYRVRYKIVQGL